MVEIQLQKEITTFDGEPFQLADTGLEKLQIGNVLIRQLALAKTDGENVFLTPRIGEKLVSAIKTQQSLLLEKAELDHLKLVVTQNNAQFVDLVQSQLLQSLKDATEVEVKRVE